MFAPSQWSSTDATDAFMWLQSDPATTTPHPSSAKKSSFQGGGSWSCHLDFEPSGWKPVFGPSGGLEVAPEKAGWGGVALLKGEEYPSSSSRRLTPTCFSGPLTLFTPRLSGPEAKACWGPPVSDGHSSVASKLNLLFTAEARPWFGTFSHSGWLKLCSSCLRTTLRSPNTPLHRELERQKRNYLLHPSSFALYENNHVVMVVCVCMILTQITIYTTLNFVGITYKTSVENCTYKSIYSSNFMNISQKLIELELILLWG